MSASGQPMVTETRDPNRPQDEEFAAAVKGWTTQPYFSSPLVDHLPKVDGIPAPKQVLGYHIGAPAKLTYYADINGAGRVAVIRGSWFVVRSSWFVVRSS